MEPLFDWIIVDSPPALPVSDASVLAKACDGVLMVVRSNSTPSDVARKARQEFPDEALLGVVLNGTSEDAAPYERYYYEAYQKKASRDQGLGGSSNVIRLFNVYYPVRTLVLLVVETLIICFSFVLGVLGAVAQKRDWRLFLNDSLFIEGGYLKVLAVTGIVLLLSHGFDLYDYGSLGSKWEQSFPHAAGSGPGGIFSRGGGVRLPTLPAWTRFSPWGLLGSFRLDVYASGLARGILLDCAAAFFP